MKLSFPSATLLAPLLACAAQASSSSLDLSDYAPTPFGHVLKHCIHEIPSGSETSEEVDGRSRVKTPGGKVFHIPKCETRGRRLLIPRVSESSTLGNLPPDYKGWLQYTAINITRIGLTGGFDSFTNVMSVPDVPKRRPQVLYLFPGLQNIDWSKLLPFRVGNEE